MAKKRRKQEEEEFKLPEFDEEGFLRKEITGAKMIILIIILAVFAAVISYLLTLAGVVVVAFFAGFGCILLLKYIPRMFEIDTSKLERKDWIGYGSTYFFAWLAIWVLAMNVPFSDVTAPELVVLVNGNEVAPGGSVTIQASPADLTVKTTDNAGISSVWFVTDPPGTRVDMVYQGGNTWFQQVVVPSSETREVTVTVEDVNGHMTSMTITLWNNS